MEYRQGFVTLVTATTLALSGGCGGGSSTPQSLTPAPPPPPDFLQGTLLDSPVAGVSFSTATQSGTTDSNGRFRYRAGEVVTFNLGTLTLGTAPGASEVTVFDLAEVSAPTDLEAFWDDLRVNGQPGPMHKAVNIAVLLQSLDADSNPENGINIPAAAATLISSADLDLAMAYGEFEQGGNPWDGNGLPGLLRRLADEGALTARAPVGAGLAVNHVLEQLGQSTGFPIARSYSQDQDMDGAIDYLRLNAYNVDGYIARQSYDTDGDGVENRIYEFTYDAATGKQTRLSRDDDGDGTADSVSVTQYNEFGQILRRETTTAGVVTELEIWDYDENGRLIRRERDVPRSHTIEHWIVDGNNLRSIQDYDSDGDGTIDLRNVLSYGDQTRSDRWLVRDIDDDLDGVFDGQQTRSFDAFGRVLTSYLDSDLDGTPDSVNEWDYGEHGVTRQHVVRADGSGYTFRYDYNAQGLLSQFSADQNLDGEIDRFTYYDYDSQGNRTRQANDSDADGVLDAIYTSTFDAQGNQLSWESDNDGDGVPNTRETFTYDAEGRRVSSDYDRGADGTTDVFTEWSDWIVLPFGSYL